MSSTTAPTPIEPAPVACFEGFAWSVPTAFAAALAGFRFEQGDVLYRTPDAYAAQADAAAVVGPALQILLPKRSARATSAEAEGDRRTALWESEVVLDRVDLDAGTTETLSVSQGKLLMTLWTGDEGWLDPERAEPLVPLSARELAGRLEETEATLDGALKKTKRGARFLFVVDLASDASRAKAKAIEEALAALGDVERVERTAARSGVSDADRFHPALRVRGLAVAGADPERVQTALRGALYGGGSPSEEESEGAPDRFSVARHGRLAALGAD